MAKRSIKQCWLLAGNATLMRLGVLATVLLVAALLAVLGQDKLTDLLLGLEALVAEHWMAALLLYLLSFVVLAVLALPVGTVFCLAAGYLFGLAWGASAALIGSALAAAISFALARLFGGLRLRRRFDETRLRPLFETFERDAAWYLLLLRIVPVAPFFAVNVGAALSQVSFCRFQLATVLGLLPSVVIYASVGSSLGTMLQAESGMDLLLRADVGLPLLALGALVALSLLLRWRFFPAQVSAD